MAERATLIVIADSAALASLSRRRRDALFAHGAAARLARGGVVVEARAEVKRFFLALAANAPNHVGDEEMAELLFGWRRDGGPDDMAGTLHRLGHDARLIGAALGYVVERYCGGYRARAIGTKQAEAAE